MSDRMNRIMERLNKQRSDDNFVEAKAGGGKLDKAFWSTVSAFANTSGGIIVLGVLEDTAKGEFRVNPDFDFKRANDQLISAFRRDQEKPPVTPLPHAVIEADEFEGSPVICVEVSAMRGDPVLGKMMPCYITAQGPKDGSYKRVLDGDKRLSPYEVFQLQTLHTTDYSELEEVQRADIADLQKSAWTSLLDSLAAVGSRILQGTQKEIEGLERLSVVSKKGVPTLAGILSLGIYPQQFYPQLFIDVAVHPEPVKSMSETRFIDRRHCDGPLPVAIEDAINAVKSHLRTRSVEHGSKMIDELEIPEIALREAIVNAVMHRDYSPQVQGRQVQVDVYPDRVEINNPGGLYGDRTVENLDENRSTARNPQLAVLLSYLRTPNGSSRVAENAGSGIQRMRAGMRNYGLPQPEFRARIADFTVVLYRFGLLTSEMSQWLNDVAPGASKEQQIALALARGFGTVTVAELRANIGLDSDDARRVLAVLVSSGALAVTDDPDRFALNSSASDLNDTEIALVELLTALPAGQSLSARELAEEVGLTLNTIRPYLRNLVELELVEATAPPTSKNRRYRLPGAPYEP